MRRGVQCQKRPNVEAKRPNVLSKETQCIVKRDPMYCQKRPNVLSKETQCRVNSGLLGSKKDLTLCFSKKGLTLVCQSEAKETRCSVKRDQRQCQKRPNKGLTLVCQSEPEQKGARKFSNSARLRRRIHVSYEQENKCVVYCHVI
jgi:hypothetical protein